MVSSPQPQSTSDSSASGRPQTPVVVENLEVTLERTAALRRASFRVDEGERVVVLGAVGSGKTTLLQVLAGLVKPDRRSQVKIFGADPWKSADLVGRVISYLPQKLRLWESLTIDQTFEIARGLSTSWSREREDILRERFPFAGQRMIKDLAPLERRLLGTSISFAAETQLWLLDSPTGKLESRARHDILTPLRELMDEAFLGPHAPKASIMTTNHPDDAAIFGNRLIILDRGRIRLDQNIESLTEGAREIIIPAQEDEPPKLKHAIVDRRAGDTFELIVGKLEPDEAATLDALFGDAWQQRPISLETLFVRTTGFARTGISPSDRSNQDSHSP